MNSKHEVAKQLDFIISSCRLYDEGRHQETIRIALVARVLFHQTARQQSLIRSHCGKPDIKLRSTTMLKMPTPIQPHPLGFLSLELNTGNFKPMLDTGQRNEPMPFDDWWKEPVLNLMFAPVGETITREQIILLAAERDGGAHVDKNKPIWYERLTAGLEFSAILRTASGKKTRFFFFRMPTLLPCDKLGTNF
jgi:hypothetical protein